MTAGGCDECVQGHIGQHVENSSGARIEGGRRNRSRDNSGIKRKQRTAEDGWSLGCGVENG